jgi:hypothetical protein
VERELALAGGRSMSMGSAGRRSGSGSAGQLGRRSSSSASTASCGSPEPAAAESAAEQLV